jgi:hypothetical protein
VDEAGRTSVCPPSTDTTNHVGAEVDGRKCSYKHLDGQKLQWAAGGRQRQSAIVRAVRQKAAKTPISEQLGNLTSRPDTGKFIFLVVLILRTPIPHSCVNACHYAILQNFLCLRGRKIMMNENVL